MDDKKEKSPNPDLGAQRVAPLVKELNIDIYGEEELLDSHDSKLDRIERKTKIREIAYSENHNRELVDWKRARAAIEHENLLVHHRMTWLISSHTGLFAVAGVIIANKSALNLLFNPLLLVVSLLGFLFSFNVFVNMRRADIQGGRITKWWKDNYPEPNSSFDLHYWNRSEFFVTRLFRIYMFPLYFSFVWVILVGALITDFPDISAEFVSEGLKNLWIRHQQRIEGIIFTLMLLTGVSGIVSLVRRGGVKRDD